MRATFFGIEIGRRAIEAHRLALDVTGHNIANANTPGYSRQVARLATTTPYAAPAFNRPGTTGQVGTGVYVQQIVRMHDSFIQQQINTEINAKSYWERRQQILQELELSFLEPTDVGIRSALDQFWQALQDLSKNPESAAARSVVRERALVLTETVRNTYAQFAPLQQNLDFQVRAAAERINALARQIAQLNTEIRKVLVAGNTPNDLYDTRDMLIEELAKYADVQVVQRDGGMIAVTIGGVALVDGVNARAIEVQSAPGTGFATLVWSGTNLGVTVSSGELKALLEARDVELPRYMEQLNEFVRALIKEVNAVHEQGYGLLDTFDPADYDNDPSLYPPPPGIKFFNDGDVDPTFWKDAAANFSLSDAILEDARNIAASLSGTHGDGANALRLAQIHQKTIDTLGGGTLGEYLGAIVSGLGVQSGMAVAMVEHQEVLLGHLERLRASVSGVSIDEEMANLIQHQHAYAAAARLVTTVDEAIDTIINRMGLVGRA